MIIIVCIKKIAVINTHAPPTCSTKEMASMGSHLGPRRSAPRHRIDPAKVAEDPKFALIPNPMQCALPATSLPVPGSKEIALGCAENRGFDFFRTPIPYFHLCIHMS